jgi:nitrate/TMAO reductase-like tetraheme cytochrome c subunit
MFRHGLDIVLVATIVNLLIVAVASYRGAAYMDSPQFCGQSCHVMHPEYTAYKISAHSHVACVECHIGSGAESYVQSQGERHQAACRGHVSPHCAFRPSHSRLSHADSSRR